MHRSRSYGGSTGFGNNSGSLSSSSRGGTTGAMDPTRLARFFDQDWAKASYGVGSNINNNRGGMLGSGNQYHQATVSPYASLDLDRPRSALENSISLMSQSGGGITLNGGNSLTESGRDLNATYAPLSAMAATTTEIPSLPDTRPEAIQRIPETDEQVGSNFANRTLRLARSTGDLKTQAIFKDSKFMFGFCSRQRAEILTPRSVPLPTDQLGRLSTCEERRNELFLNKSIKLAETMMKKADGQKSRRTQLMEVKHKYLLEGDNYGDFKPSKTFLDAQKKRRHHAKRTQRIRRQRTKELMAIENTQSRRGFDFIRDHRSQGQAPLQRQEMKLTQTLGRVKGSHNESTFDRLYIRDKKGINKARQQYLYNKNVGCKPHNIITGAALLIQPTEAPPKPRRDCHPSIVIHGMSQFGSGK